MHGAPPSDDTNKRKLLIEEIQNKALSTCVGIERGWYRALEGELGIDNLNERREKTLLKYYLKASKMTENRIPKRILKTFASLAVKDERTSSVAKCKLSSVAFLSGE